MRLIRCKHATLALILVVAVLPVGGGCSRPGASNEGGGGVATLHTAAAGKLELKLCAWASKENPALCGEFPVYENRAAGSGRILRLPVVVLLARGKATSDALTLLGGGPSQAATDFARGLYQGGLEELRRTRDILLVDQRGAGASSPLGCDLTGGQPGAKPFTGELFPSAALKKCSEGWQADPALYHTTLAVEDLDELRAALGYQQLNLHGISYGTRYAQVYARRYPQRARTLVLEGVLAMSVTMPLPFARDAQRSLERMFEDCAREAACAAAYPRLREEFTAVMERLAKQPAQARVRITSDASEENIQVTRELLATATRSILYSIEGRSRLPKMVHDAYRGDYSGWAQIAMRIRRSHYDGLGMYVPVVCADDVAFLDRTRVAAETAGTYIGDYWFRQLAAACDAVPHGKAPANFHQRLESPVPALLLSGYLDPVTPPELGDEVAAGLPNSVHVVMPNRSHGLNDEDFACSDGVLAQFIERGSAKELDTSCLLKLPTRRFVLPN